MKSDPNDTVGELVPGLVLALKKAGVTDTDKLYQGIFKKNTKVTLNIPDINNINEVRI